MLAFLTRQFKRSQPRARCRLWSAATVLLLTCAVSSVHSEELPVTAFPEPPPLASAAGLESVAEADLRSWLTFLASPELQGRLPGSRGYDVAAQFCVSVFQSFGVDPVGDVASGQPTYFQRFTSGKLVTKNVVGCIRGRDDRLRHEYVVVGAHLDHLGSDEDLTYSGADDNASGVSGVLSLARAFSETGVRPRRSILLVLYGAEELGLWGSQHFVKFPPVPLESIVAKLNLDMIGRNEESSSETAEENKNRVHLVGSRRRSDHLHRLILASNRSIGLDFEYDEERVYNRSDHYSFGEVGIPVAFFFTGFHPDYHEVSDTVDKINFEKMTRIVRLVYLTAFAVADLEGKLRRSARF